MMDKDTERAALAQFEAMLDAYGAAPPRWPAGRRAAAEALLARSPEAQALQARAARLDLLIAEAGIEPVPAHLIGRVLASAPAARPARRSWFAGLLKPALGIAVAAFLGLGLGGVISPFGPGEAAEAESVALDIGVDPEIEL